MRGKTNMGLLYSRYDNFDKELQCELQVFVDADCTSKSTDNPSVSGATVICGLACTIVLTDIDMCCAVNHRGGICCDG